MRIIEAPAPLDLAVASVRVAALLATLVLSWASGVALSAQPIGKPLFLSVVRMDGILVPIAVHNGAEWWGGWPMAPEEDIASLAVPESLSAMPAEWLPPGLALPRRWTFWRNAGGVQRVQIQKFTRTGSVMTMIGLRTGLTENRSDFEQWVDGDDEAGIAVSGRAEIGRVVTLDETSADWVRLWEEELRERLRLAETAAIADWVKGAAGTAGQGPGHRNTRSPLTIETRSCHK